MATDAQDHGVRRVCVFCGSKEGNDPKYLAAAKDLGTALARRGVSLVYGGGGRGMMGAVADSVLAAGGKAIGVIPRNLFVPEGLHTSLSEQIFTSSMHERKATMESLADAFVSLPGGLGTLEEMFEMWTWSQLRIHTKPCSVMNVDGYFDTLVHFLDEMRDAAFLASEHRDLLIVESSPERLLDKILDPSPR